MNRSLFDTLLLYVLLGTVVVGCTGNDDWQQKLDYEVVRQSIFDQPSRTQVDEWLHVSGSLTEENLRGLLWARYDSVMHADTYEHHQQPTNVYIFLFDSRKSAKQGGSNWRAMLEKRRGQEPSVRTEKKQ